MRVKIKKSHLKELIRNSIIETLFEADDDKYTHIGYGRYKKKGQEKKTGAPTFQKTDDGKYVPYKSDTDASDDDVKGAAKNIIMQMRKVVSMRGNFDVEFLDKKKKKVPVKIAQAVQDKFNSFKKPADKEKFQAQAAKSYNDMLKVLKAGYYEEVEIDEALPGKWPAPGVKKGTRKDLEKLEKELRDAKKKKDKKKAAALQKELEALMKSGKGKKIGPAWMHKEETILDRIDRKLKERKNG